LLNNVTGTQKLGYKNPVTFFFFDRHCKPCGFWPAHLSLNILSRKVFFYRVPLPAARQTPNLEILWH